MTNTRRIGTVCFFVDLDQQKILLFRIKYGEGDEKWNGVGGFADPGEKASEAVSREVEEELGLKVEPELFREVKVVEKKELELHVFVCDKLVGDPKILDSTLTRFKWFDFDEVPYEEMWEGNDKWLPEVLNSLSSF